MLNKKSTVAALILCVTMLTGCAARNTESESTANSTTADTSATAATTTTSAATTAEQTTAESTPMESTPEETMPEFFTQPASDSITSAECLTLEGVKGVWAHLVNPYNKQSLYWPTSSADFPAGTESIVICFDVTGVTNELSAFCGLLAYGRGEDDDELQVWNNNTYKKLSGEDFEFIIAEDGYYEMEVPVSKLAAGLDYWEGLDYISIIEVAFFGAETVDDAGEYTATLTEGLSIEFHGIKAVKGE